MEAEEARGRLADSSKTLGEGLSRDFTHRAKNKAAVSRSPFGVVFDLRPDAPIGAPVEPLFADYPPYESDEERAEAEETQRDIRCLTEQFIRIKQEPSTLKFGDAGLKALEEFVDEGLLDEYFTIRVLGSVVLRWDRVVAGKGEQVAGGQQVNGLEAIVARSPRMSDHGELRVPKRRA